MISIFFISIFLKEFLILFEFFILCIVVHDYNTGEVNKYISKGWLSYHHNHSIFNFFFFHSFILSLFIVCCWMVGWLIHILLYDRHIASTISPFCMKKWVYYVISLYNILYICHSK